MNQGDAKNKRSNSVYASGRSGTKHIIRKKSLSPFWGDQEFYKALPFAGEYLKGYGWDPLNEAYLVWINYQRRDPWGRLLSEPCIVAGYISVRNVPLTGIFSQDNKYRIGVEVDSLTKSISARIDLAKRAIKQAEGKRRINLQCKLNILESKKKVTLKKLKDAGWTHIVLATGWREVIDKLRFIDRLDINFSYFDFFYPEKAFPIGLPDDESLGSWVGRDKIVEQFLPNGRIVPSRTKEGWRLRNQYELKINKSLSQFRNLKITFNHTRKDVWSEQTGRGTKLIASTRWPTIKEVVEENKKNLEEHPYGEEAAKARGEALDWVDKFLREAAICRKKGWKKPAERYEWGAKELREAVEMSYEREQKKLIDDTKKIPKEKHKKAEDEETKKPKSTGDSTPDKKPEPTAEEKEAQEYEKKQEETITDIKNIKKEDTTGDILVKAAAKGLNGITEIQARNGDKDGKLYNETMDALSEKYIERIDGQMEDIKEMDPLDPRIDDQMGEILDSYAWFNITSGGNDEFQKKFDEKYDEIRATAKKVYNARIKDKLRVIQTFKADDPQRITQMVEIMDNQAFRQWIGLEGMAQVEKWRDVVTDTLKKRYKINSNLDDDLKFLITIQLTCVDGTIPEALLEDPQIRDFVEQKFGKQKEHRDNIEKKIERETKNLPELLVRQIKQGNVEGKVIR